MDAFIKLVTIFYSGFHKYLKEAGYDLFDLDIQVIIFDSTADSFPLHFWNVLISVTKKSCYLFW